jgi:hypothetical protein
MDDKDQMKVGGGEDFPTKDLKGSKNIRTLVR